MPEFLEKRFNATSRWMLSVISLVAYVLTKIAVGIFAGGIVFSVLVAGIESVWSGQFLDRIDSGHRPDRYLHGPGWSARGGVYRSTADVHSGRGFGTRDLFWAAQVLGGWRHSARSPAPRCSICGSRWFPSGVDRHVVARARSGQQMAWYFNDNYPWLGMLFCAPIIGLWYWCTDQYIVQRTLGAPNEQQARRGSIFAGMLKLLPVFIFIIPGMIAYAIATTGKNEALTAAMMDGQGEVIRDQAQAAFPLLVKHVLPVGVRGMVVAGLLAALMSSLAGVFNASATLFTMDFYTKLHPQVSQHRLVWIGRIATTVMVLIGLAWIPVIRGGRGLYDYLQGVQAYLAPPIFVVFFLGVFNKRLNGAGCLATLTVGFLMGLFRLAVDTPVKLDWAGLGGGYPEGSFFWVVNNTFFQYYSLLIFIVCIIVMVAVNYSTEEPAYERINGLTYATTSAKDREDSRASWDSRDVIGSFLSSCSYWPPICILPVRRDQPANVKNIKAGNK